MRKKLREHNWLELARKDPNPSATLRRLTYEANKAINDLVLLAEKLPDDRVAEIFSKANTGKMVHQILEGNRYEKKDVAFEGRITQIAALLVRLGTTECIKQYQLKVEPNSILNEPIINHLKRTHEICDEIASKMYLPNIKSKIGSDVAYFFNWNKVDEMSDIPPDKVRGDDNKTFINFVRYPHGYSDDNIEYVRRIHFRDDFREADRLEFKWINNQVHLDNEGYLELAKIDMCVKVFFYFGDTEKLVTTLPIRIDNDDTYVLVKNENMKDLYD